MAVRILVVLIAALVWTAADARAQTTPAWDTAVSTGLYFGHPAAPPPSRFGVSYYERWYNTGDVDISVGRYLTPHLKAEAEFGLTGTGERYVTELTEMPGRQTFPISSEHRISSRRAGATLAWQFFENQWAHPFVFAGAEVASERTEIESFARGASSRRENVVRGILGAGAKMYVTPQAFFRTDARVGIGDRNRNQVTLRLGLGVDF